MMYQIPKVALNLCILPPQAGKKSIKIIGKNNGCQFIIRSSFHNIKAPKGNKGGRSDSPGPRKVVIGHK